MDSDIKPSFPVHKENGDIMKFAEYCNGLYLYNTSDPGMQLCIVQTVNGNEKCFHKGEVEQTKEARQLYATLGRLLYKKIMKN